MPRSGATLEGRIFPLSSDDPFGLTILRSEEVVPPVRVPDGGSENRGSAMKPSPYTDHYSQQEIDDNYEAGLWSTDTFHDLLARRVKDNPDKVFATDGTRFDLPAAPSMVPSGWPSVYTGKDGGPVTPPPCSCRAGGVRAGARQPCRVLGSSSCRSCRSTGAKKSTTWRPTPKYEASFTPATLQKFNYLDMYLGLRQEHPDLTIVVARPDSAAETVIDADSRRVQPAGAGGRDRRRRRPRGTARPARSRRAVRHRLHLRNHAHGRKGACTPSTPTVQAPVR